MKKNTLDKLLNYNIARALRGDNRGLIALINSSIFNRSNEDTVREIEARQILVYETLARLIQDGHFSLFNQVLAIQVVKDWITVNANGIVLGAAKIGCLDTLNLLLKEIPDLLEHVDADDNHALREAAFHNNPEVLTRLLILKNVQNRANAKENTALAHAARRGSTFMVKCLLEVPVVYKLFIENSAEVLSMAAVSGNLDLLNYLLKIPGVEKQLTPEALIKAASWGHLAITNRLLAIPAMRDSADAEKNTALTQAFLHNRVEVVKSLLQIPTVFNLAIASDDELSFAIKQGHLPIINYLLQIAPFYERLITNGGHFLTIAVGSEARAKVLNRLFQIPAIKTQAAFDENFMLWWTAQNDDMETVKLLLQVDCVISQVFSIPSRHSRKVLQSAFEVAIERFLNYSVGIPTSKLSVEQYSKTIALFNQIKSCDEVKSKIDVEKVESDLTMRYQKAQYIASINPPPKEDRYSFWRVDTTNTTVVDDLDANQYRNQ